MNHTLFPNEEIDSTYEIDFAAYYQEGYRGVIFDIDNTLVPHGAPADARAIALFSELHALGFQTLVLSNNKEPRVRTFAEPVDSLYIYKGGKPAGRGYLKAMELMGTDTTSTLFVGDQIFTDVWGARRVGIRSILVHPIHPKEEIQIVLKRRLEWPILKAYRKSKYYRRAKQRDERG